MPHDFPPWQTVFWYFKQWRADGTTDRVHDPLRDRVRDGAGRDPMALAAIVDAQSVEAADTVGVWAVPGSRRFGVRDSGQGLGLGLLEFGVADHAFVMKVGQARDLLGGTAAGCARG